jgi:RNA polymerase-binding transcription factor DksA
MSGYTGNPDAESEHALILAENGIHAVRQLLQGDIVDICVDCEQNINPLRVQLMKRINMTCMRCVVCQQVHDKLPKQRIKMLDKIL